MTKEEYLRLAVTKWPELKTLKAAGDFYAYEKRFAEIWLELGRAVLESSIGEVPVDAAMMANTVGEHFHLSENCDIQLQATQITLVQNNLSAHLKAAYMKFLLRKEPVIS